jgi:RimJ/RimL family protein N-acetyltransferase
MTALDTQPVLETERLFLRRPTLDDLDRWSEMMADPDCVRFIGGVLPRQLVWRSIMQNVGAWELVGVSMFSVVEKARGVWIGRVGPWEPPGWPGAEIGWALHRDAWGRGYAFEAAVAAMNYAFDTLEWPKVVHCIAPENVRSRALAARLGARIERQAVMPPPWDHETVDVWAQTSDEWRASARMRDLTEGSSDS